ncbi:MAG: GNAT family N-acetyltransferase [Chloroflexia bacterium]
MTEHIISATPHRSLNLSRAYRPEDLPLLVQLLIDAGAWPSSGPPTPDLIISRWTRRGVRPEEQVRVLDDNIAGLQAFWHAAPYSDSSGRLGFDIVVHPRFRQQGLGSAILALVESDAAFSGSRRMTCPVFVPAAGDVPVGAHFLHNRGYRTDHGYWHMRLDDIARQTSTAWPPGISVRGIVNLEEDVELWCRLVLHAFSEETTPSGVLAQMREPGGSPDGYFFAVDNATGRAVGTSRARIDTSGRVKVGYVGTVGVIPQYRRRGIAEALIRHTLAHLVTIGLESATLFVERQNVAARRIYDAMGWRPIYRTDHYWKAVTKPPEH